MSETAMYEELRRRVVSVNDAPTRTKQSFAPECNVNTIVSRYQRGIVPQMNRMRAAYADVSGIPDLMEIHRRIVVAEEAFSSLPAKVRKEFQNDPFRLISFVQDEKNRAECVRLGLVESDKPTEGSGAPASAGAPAVGEKAAPIPGT